MRLSQRVADLEQSTGSGAKAWVRIFQYEGQAEEDAIAAYEAEKGPLDDKNVILRVIIRKFFAQGPVGEQVPLGG